jgi:hypothetical protein
MELEQLFKNSIKLFTRINGGYPYPLYIFWHVEEQLPMA